jgi:hypothetical protein
VRRTSTALTGSGHCKIESEPSICADPIRGALGGVGIEQVARHRYALTLIYEDGKADGCPRVLTDERG